MARACRHWRMVFEVRVLMHFKRDLTHAARAPLGGEKCWKKELFFFSLHPDSALWSTFLSLHLSFHLHLKSVSQLLARLCSHQQWGKHSNTSRKYLQFQMSSTKPHWLYTKMCHHLRIPSLTPLEFPVHSGTEDSTFECVCGVDGGS